MMTTLSNWGRWGKDNQLGTLNLITKEKRKRAAALVKEENPFPSPGNWQKASRAGVNPLNTK